MSNQLLNTKNIRKGAKGSFAVPKDFSPEGKRFAQSIVDNIQQLTGEKGNALDKAVTFNDLVNAGIAKKQFVLTDGGSNFVIGPGDNQGVDTPTAPTGASASGAFQNILIEWDYPSYVGHSHTEIFVSTTDDFASVEISKGRLSPKFLGQTTASVFSHQVSAGSTRFYFIRHVNQNDLAGPAHGTSGLQASTALIDTALIQDNLITAAKIVDGAVSTVKIATDAVTNAKIAVDAIQGDVIAAGAITEAKIGASAITTTKIADDAISTPKISANAITASEIASNAITSVKINANAITTAKINAGAVTATEIATNAVTSDKINANAVSADKIAANSIAASKMVAGTITAASGIIADAAILSAKIADGAIINAKIADATIDNAKITSGLSAAKITADQMNADRVKIDNLTLDTDGSGNLILKDNGVVVNKLGSNSLGRVASVYVTGQSYSQQNFDLNNFKSIAPLHFFQSTDKFGVPIGSPTYMGADSDGFAQLTIFGSQIKETGNFVVHYFVDFHGSVSGSSVESTAALNITESTSSSSANNTTTSSYVSVDNGKRSGSGSFHLTPLHRYFTVNLIAGRTYKFFLYAAGRNFGNQPSGASPSVTGGISVHRLNRV